MEDYSVKIIVAGGRTFDDYGRALPVLDEPCFYKGSIKYLDGVTIVSGGYIRNEEMAKYADILVALWDGESKGTKHMIDLALKHRLEVHVHPYELSDTGKVM